MDRALPQVVVVTPAEATPGHEAERLQRDLERAGIKPFAWVIGQSLLAWGQWIETTGQENVEFIRCRMFARHYYVTKNQYCSGLNQSLRFAQRLLPIR